MFHAMSIDLNTSCARILLPVTIVLSVACTANLVLVWSWL